MLSRGIGLVVALEFLACIPALAQKSGLDAPVSGQPTVRTEIARGQEVGFECSLNNLTNKEKFVGCVNDSVTSNRQNSSLSEPFEFGLYVSALQQASVMGLTPASEGFITIWHDQAAKIMKARKLQLADYCKAVESMKCDLAAMNQRTYGLGAK